MRTFAVQGPGGAAGIGAGHASLTRAAARVQDRHEAGGHSRNMTTSRYPDTLPDTEDAALTLFECRVDAVTRTAHVRPRSLWAIGTQAIRSPWRGCRRARPVPVGNGASASAFRHFTRPRAPGQNRRVGGFCQSRCATNVGAVGNASGAGHGASSGGTRRGELWTERHGRRTAGWWSTSAARWRTRSGRTTRSPT